MYVMAKLKKKGVKMDSAIDRKKFIGGSDAAAVMGLSRYKTALQVWALKTGQIEAPNLDDVVSVQLGNKLEQAVCELFMEETGKKVQRVNDTIFHPEHDFIGANIDRRVVGERAGFEAKTTSQFKSKEWQGQEIPAEYYCQCVHYMAVTGWPVWYLGVLIGNTTFVWKVLVRTDADVDLSQFPPDKIYRIEPKIINQIVEREVDFWNNYVVPKVMPMQISANDSDVLFDLFPSSQPESTVELGDDASKICESLDSMEADLKVLEKEIEQQKNTLKAFLKDNEAGLTPKYKITWKNQLARRMDTSLFKKEQPEMYNRYSPERSSRVLRVSIRKDAE